jgi:hypothetical protein
MIQQAFESLASKAASVVIQVVAYINGSEIQRNLESLLARDPMAPSRFQAAALLTTCLLQISQGSAVEYPSNPVRDPSQGGFLCLIYF